MNLVHFTSHSLAVVQIHSELKKTHNVSSDILQTISSPELGQENAVKSRNNLE